MGDPAINYWHSCEYLSIFGPKCSSSTSIVLFYTHCSFSQFANSFCVIATSRNNGCSYLETIQFKTLLKPNAFSVVISMCWLHVSTTDGVAWELPSNQRREMGCHEVDTQHRQVLICRGVSTQRASFGLKLISVGPDKRFVCFNFILWYQQNRLFERLDTSLTGLLTLYSVLG